MPALFSVIHIYSIKSQAKQLIRNIKPTREGHKTNFEKV